MEDTIRILMFIRNGWMIRVIGDIAIIADSDSLSSRQIKVRADKSCGSLIAKAGASITQYIDNSNPGVFNHCKDRIIEMTLKNVVSLYYSDLAEAIVKKEGGV